MNQYVYLALIVMFVILVFSVGFVAGVQFYEAGVYRERVAKERRDAIAEAVALAAKQARDANDDVLVNIAVSDFDVRAAEQFMIQNDMYFESWFSDTHAKHCVTLSNESLAKLGAFGVRYAILTEKG